MVKSIAAVSALLVASAFVAYQGDEGCSGCPSKGKDMKPVSAAAGDAGCASGCCQNRAVAALMGAGCMGGSCGDKTTAVSTDAPACCGSKETTVGTDAPKCCGDKTTVVAAKKPSCCGDKQTMVAAKKGACCGAKTATVSTDAPACCGSKVTTVGTDAPKCCGDKTTAVATKKPSCCGDKQTMVAAKKGACCGAKTATVSTDAPACCGSQSKVTTVGTDAPKCCGDKQTTVAAKKGACCGDKTKLVGTEADGKACPSGKCAGMCGKDCKDCPGGKCDGNCKDCPIEVAMQKLPQMTYMVGTESTKCPKTAAKMAADAKAKVRYVVADKTFADKVKATTALADATEHFVAEFTAPQECPKTGKCTLAGKTMQCKVTAGKLAAQAKAAMDKVQMTYLVGAKSCACPKEAAKLAKDSGKPTLYVVGQEKTPCSVTARINLARAKYRAAVVALLHAQSQQITQTSAAPQATAGT